MTARRKLPYKPWLEVTAALGVDPQASGVVVAILHVKADHSLTLREYAIQGPQCEHVVSNQQDLSEIDKLVEMMKMVSRQLHLTLKIDGDAIATLTHPD